jgi:Domain of unknown function (DUF4351)
MSPFQDDDFSKAYTTALYRTKGTVKTNVLVKSDENLAIDLMFVGNLQNSAWTTEKLGLFDNLMQAHPTIFVEHYSGYLNPSHIIRCVTRMDLYVSGEKKAAKKRDEKFLDEQKPFTWILATACSEETLQSFGANPNFTFGSGIYRLVPGLRIGVVVIRDLPKTPETLWLRGLGKDNILTTAFADIRELPDTKRERNAIVEVCVKHFKYLTEKPSVSEEEADFMKTMQEIDTIYQSEMNRVRLEGRQEQGCKSVLRQLGRRVGNVSIDLQEQIKALTLEQLEILGDDLLDFTQLGDLLAWLERYQ